MKAVLYASSIAEAYYARDLLRAHGIGAEVGNETISQLWGGEPADLSVKPSVWIVDESRAAEAEAILADRTPHATEEEWECAACASPNPGTFTACWSCQRER